MIYRKHTEETPAPSQSLEPPEQFDPIKSVKRYWPYLAGGVFLVLAISFGLFRFATRDRQVAAVANNASSSTPVAMASTTDSLVPRALDGIMVPPDQAHLQPLAVMVEMHPDARPLSGVSQANLVYEAPVEGGITRLMAVFDATTTVRQVGPVRSARPYFVEWADALHAVYAHVGGSPEALNRLSGLLKVRNLDEMANGKYFWRSSRPAPHNAYTGQSQLLSAVKAKGWQPDAFATWSYDSSTNTQRGEVNSVAIPYGGSYNVRWGYDAAKDVYVRYQSGKKFQDADGSVVTAKNILVVLTEQRILDDEGRLYIRTVGSGKALLYRNGDKQEVRWSRSPGEHMRIETNDGRDVAMTPGTTWIEVVTLPEQMPDAKSASSTVQ